MALDPRRTIGDNAGVPGAIRLVEPKATAPEAIPTSAAIWRTGKLPREDAPHLLRISGAESRRARRSRPPAYGRPMRPQGLAERGSRSSARPDSERVNAQADARKQSSSEEATKRAPWAVIWTRKRSSAKPGISTGHPLPL